MILLDLHPPDRSGLDVIGALIADNPDLRVVILTGYAEDHEVAMALRHGAMGCVLKPQAYSDLVQAIENAYQGRSSVPPRIAKFVLQLLNPPKRLPPGAASGLGEAEQRILVYVAQGLESKEIARQLGISRPTVHAHVSHILSKLQLDNRTQAAIYAVKHGFISLSNPRATPSSILMT